MTTKSKPKPKPKPKPYIRPTLFVVQLDEGYATYHNLKHLFEDFSVDELMDQNIIRINLQSGIVTDCKLFIDFLPNEND